MARRKHATLRLRGYGSRIIKPRDTEQRDALYRPNADKKTLMEELNCLALFVFRERYASQLSYCGVADTESVIEIHKNDYFLLSSTAPNHPQTSEI